MNSKKIKNLTYSALFAALIAVAIAFLPKITFPGGYAHLGDFFIFMAASMLPLPYAAAAAAIGGALGDVLAGGAQWAPFTLVIKALVVCCFTAKRDNILCKRNWIAPLPALVITVAGYFAAEAIIYGSALTALVASVPYNVLQIVASAVLFYIAGFACDKAKLKKIISR